jgi:hypothetical protein
MKHALSVLAPVLVALSCPPTLASAQAPKPSAIIGSITVKDVTPNYLDFVSVQLKVGDSDVPGPILCKVTELVNSLPNKKGIVHVDFSSHPCYFYAKKDLRQGLKQGQVIYLFYQQINNDFWTRGEPHLFTFILSTRDGSFFQATTGKVEVQ